MHVLTNLKSKYFFLVVIFLIGFILRFYNLAGNPPSLNWDEVSNGYNAYSILKTGRDEYGNFLPLSIRSFDDYKPPLYAYLTIPSIVIFGLNEFAVRFPSAFLGSLSVIVIYLLVKAILKNHSHEGEFRLFKHSEAVALISALLFAISPWSLQFSRAAYEGNIGLFFLLLGVLCMYIFIERPKFLIIGSVFFVLSMYSYHSFRLIIPLYLIVFALLYYKELYKHKFVSLISVTIFVLFVAPIFSSFLLSDGGAGSRLSMVTVFGDSPELKKSIDRFEYDKSIGNPLGYIFENRRFVYLLTAFKGYLEHYNPGYLFIYGDGGVQHHPVSFGMLYIFSLPFMLFGLYVLFRNLDKRILLFLSLMLLAPLASSISSGAPHPVRAIIMAPVFDIWTAVGVFAFAAAVLHVRYQVFRIKLQYIILPMFFFLILINVLYYFHQYYIHTPREYGYFWQYGTKEAVKYAFEKKGFYDKVIVTYEYDQPYAFYLFHNKIDPYWYQMNWNFTKSGEMPRFERKLGNIEFRNINYGKDSTLKNTLLIGTPQEIPEGVAPIKAINFLDGKPAYKVVDTN